MARADRRARHQAAQRVGRLDLAFVAAKRMDARVERRVGALGRLGRERARPQRRAEQPLGLEQPRKSTDTSKLRAAEPREPFLWAARTRPTGSATGREDVGP